ncbi:hypothetical protein LINGRAHAP2_LOCUS12149 [Linum grandiflorum]
MQKLLLLLLITITQNGGLLQAVPPDQHDKVCIPPGSDPVYNFACNSKDRNFLPGDLLTVQQQILDFTRQVFARKWMDGDICISNIFHENDAHVKLYGYAYCDPLKTADVSCDVCLERAAQIITQYCHAYDIGGQASTDGCCIRYETKKFCIPKT